MTSDFDKDARFTSRRISPQRMIPDLVEDARAGLLVPPRSLPPKYFYDSHGSELFDRICTTPEYYVTRIEAALLERCVNDIALRSRPIHVVEFGSGAARKTGLLLAACRDVGYAPAYWPFEVCESMLHQSAAEMLREFPWLTVNALCGDYTAGLEDLPDFDGPVLYVFLGSSIGNYSEEEAVRLLSELRARMRSHDRFLLGADRIKDASILNAAYNDAEGVTAEFNLNVLRVLNDALGADFNVDGFKHQAVYVQERKQIEMYLVATRDQKASVPALNACIEFKRGERILTEISRKYDVDMLRSMLEAAGLVIESRYQPENGFFSLLLSHPA